MGVDEAALGSELFQALFEHSNDIVAIIDASGSMRYVSPSFIRTLGYKGGDLVGSNAFHLVHPDDIPHVQHAFALALAAEGTPLTVRYRYRHADGSWRVIKSTGSSHMGNPLIGGFIVNSHDITEAILSEALLHEKEAQYRGIFEASSDGMGITDFAGTVIEVNPAFCRMLGYTRDELIGLHGTSVVHPTYHEVFSDYLRTIEAGGTYQTQGLLVRKDGSAVPIEVHGSGFTYTGVPHALGVVRDVSERVQAYELLERRVAERTRELRTLLEVSHSVSTTLELRPLLNLILDGVRTLVDCTGTAILAADGDDFSIIAARGPRPEEHLVGRHFHIDDHHSILRTIGVGGMVIIDDVREVGPLADAYRELVGDLLDTTFSYIRSWLAVPLLHKEHLIGLLTISHQAAGRFKEQDVSLVRAMANQAAVTIENARLYEQAQQVAALEERQRLARELHDSVSQALYGIALGARTARAWLDKDASRAAEPLEYVLQLAEIGLAEMRSLIFELRPETLETEGLMAALQRQATMVARRHGIVVRVHCDSEPGIALAVKESLYRIAREALHNTSKHANATTSEVRLETNGAWVLLEVYDDGIGFDPHGEFPGHLGLQSTRERAQGLGGTFEVESTPGDGTRLRVLVPVRA